MGLYLPQPVLCCLHEGSLRLPLLPPVQQQLLPLERRQQLAAHLLDLRFLGLGQHRLGLGQDVEERQFLFSQPLRDAALLFGLQVLVELLQLLQEGLDVVAGHRVPRASRARHAATRAHGLHGRSDPELLLGAHAMGYGAGLTSGQAMASKRLRELCGLATDETPVCFANIGTVSKRKPGVRIRPLPTAFVTELAGGGPAVTVQ
jgi:hypothetical protein